MTKEDIEKIKEYLKNKKNNKMAEALLKKIETDETSALDIIKNNINKEIIEDVIKS